MKHGLIVFFAVFCLLPISALSAQIPQSGNYYFEIVGTQLTVDVEINGNQWDFDFGNDVKSRQIVTVNSDRNAIIIPIFAVMANDFIYDVKGDFIDFYRGDTFNLNLYDLMAKPMLDLRTYGGISRVFADIVLDGLRQSFTEAPLLRLRPIRD